jgi:hypothetical protein
MRIASFHQDAAAGFWSHRRRHLRPSSTAFRTTALLCSSSRAAYTSVTICPLLSCRGPASAPGAALRVEQALSKEGGGEPEGADRAEMAAVFASRLPVARRAAGRRCLRALFKESAASGKAPFPPGRGNEVKAKLEPDAPRPAATDFYLPLAAVLKGPFFHTPEDTPGKLSHLFPVVYSWHPRCD